MATDDSSDVLPMLNDANPGFATAMRGYDRVQVDRFLAQQDDDLQAALAERDAIAGRSADLAAQLASTRAQIESLRRQLRAASEDVTPQNVDERSRRLLETAKTEATKIRTDAQTDATAMRAGAAEAATRTRAAAAAEAEDIVAEATQRHAEADETFKRRLAEAEQHRADVEALLAVSIDRARSEEDRVTAESEATRKHLDAKALAERQRRDAESLAHRTQAEEDFELTLRKRRTAETNASAAQHAAAAADAARTIGDAHATARQLVDDATAEVRHLHTQRDEAHRHLQELHHMLGDALERTLAATPTAPEPSAATAQ
ncbi:MAG: DivIVA domain-containing protein [Pseudonocardiales bacterium]